MKLGEFIRIDALSANIRFYKTPVDSSAPLHAMKEAYYKTCTAQFRDDGEVRLSASIEAPTREEFAILYNKLAEKGYLTVNYRHKDKEYTVDLTKKPYKMCKKRK
jgi:hypothetical protein